MRRPIVAGNWKMHGSRHENARLIEDILGGYPANAEADCVVCPPFVYLEAVREALGDSAVALGAQNMYAARHGAGPNHKEKFDACLVLCVTRCRGAVPLRLRLQHPADEG